MDAGAIRASDGTVRSFDIRLGNLERAVNRLSRDFKEPVAVIRDNPLETRLIEARILFEVGNFENAAVVLFGLVDNAEFKNMPEYSEAQLMLGQAMRELGNRRSSARYLKRAAKSLIAVFEKRPSSTWSIWRSNRKMTRASERCSTSRLTRRAQRFVMSPRRDAFDSANTMLERVSLQVSLRPNSGGQGPLLRRSRQDRAQAI